MDINSLQVFNYLNKLGITDEEFKEIEEEVSHKERTGISIKCVKKGNAICISHDERHSIVIKKFKTKRDLRHTRILFKTLVLFEELPKEIYILHEIAQYRSQDTEIKGVAKTLEELKDRICDRYCDGYPKILGVATSKFCNDEEYGYHTWEYSRERTDEEAKNEAKRGETTEKQLKAIFWLFGENYDTFALKETRERVPKIIKVFERNNRRIALFEETLNHNYNVPAMFNGGGIRHVEGEVIKIKAYMPKDERYNYVDMGREVFIDDEKEIWVSDELLGKIDKNEFEILIRKMFDYDDEERKGTFLILSPDKYNQLQSSISLEILSAKRKDKEVRTREKFRNTIEEQFEKGKVIRQGIEFTKKSMTYNGICVKSDKFGEFLIYSHIILQDEPQFTKIYQDYVNWLLNMTVEHNQRSWEITGKHAEFDGDAKLSIDDLKLKVYKDRNNIFVQIKGKKSHRIPKEDINEVLHKAMEYAVMQPINIDGYEEYLAHASIVSLKLQKALEKKGMEFLLELDKTSDNILSEAYGNEDLKIKLVLPILRKNNKNYAMINGVEHKIKDMNALFDLGKDVEYVRNGKLQRSIKLLYRAIDGITPKDIGNLIEQGKKNFVEWVAQVEKERKEKISKSIEFLENAIRLTGATKVPKGYLIKGLTGNIYFIDLDKGGVWIVKKKGNKYVNDKYLCIVDSNYGEDEWQINDRIANRILALSKDSVVAPHIWNKDNWKNMLGVPTEIGEINEM